MRGAPGAAGALGSFARDLGPSVVVGAHVRPAVAPAGNNADFDGRTWRGVAVISDKLGGTGCMNYSAFVQVMLGVGLSRLGNVQDLSFFIVNYSYIAWPTEYVMHQKVLAIYHS